MWSAFFCAVHIIGDIENFVTSKIWFKDQRRPSSRFATVLFRGKPYIN